MPSKSTISRVCGAWTWREPQAPTVLQEQRCKACRRLLCKTESRCRVEIVCPKCGTMNRLPRG